MKLHLNLRSTVYTKEQAFLTCKKPYLVGNQTCADSYLCVKFDLCRRSLFCGMIRCPGAMQCGMAQILIKGKAILSLNVATPHHLLQQYSMDNQNRNRKVKYATISLTRRKMLINEVIQKRKSINSSAKKFGIKCSTAKIIVRRFKETGTIYVRNKTQGIQIYGISDLSQSIVQDAQSVKSQHRQSPQMVQQQIQNVKTAQNSSFCFPTPYNYCTQIPFAPVLPIQPFYYMYWQ